MCSQHQKEILISMFDDHVLARIFHQSYGGNEKASTTCEFKNLKQFLKNLILMHHIKHDSGFIACIV